MHRADTRVSQVRLEENEQIDDDGRPKRKGELVTDYKSVCVYIIRL